MVNASIDILARTQRATDSSQTTICNRRIHICF